MAWISYDRDKLIDWYDERAARYDQSSFIQSDTQYGGDLYRIELVSELLKKIKPETVLDVGCGTGKPMLRLLSEGHNVRGFDISPGMIEQAKKKLDENGYSPDLAEVGDILDPDICSRFGAGAFDVVLANGVMPYISQDELAHKHFAALVKPGGMYISAYSNALFDFFTFNRFTLRFFEESLLSVSTMAEGDLSEIKNGLRGLVTNPDEPRSFVEGARNEIFVGSHNPYEVEEELLKVGLQSEDMLFYKFHAFPPLLANTPQRRKLLFDASRKLEIKYARNWRARFMASTFIVVARKVG